MLPSATPSDQDTARRDWWSRIRGFAVAIHPLAMAVIALVAPIVLALILLPLRREAPVASVALGFAVLVSLLGAIGTRMTALIAAVSAAVCYDVVFTQPYGSIVISHPQDIETTALLLVGGLIVGQLSARNRRNRGLVVQQSKDLAHIQAIAELMAAGCRAERSGRCRRSGAAKPPRTARLPVRDIATGPAGSNHRPEWECQLGSDLVGR